MLTVGLTGSIATGKTFVSRTLADLGCVVLDADRTSREVVAKGTPGLAEIVREFGDEVLLADGTLDRKTVGAIVFADAEKRARLEAIIHPRVIAEQNAWLAEQAETDPSAIAVIDAALMIESGGYKRFDKLIVVWCEPAIQLERLRLRDNLDLAAAAARIAAQMPQEEKKRFADFLIDTSKGFDDTRRQIADIYFELRLIATPL